ncbi:protein piccolo-like isoform X2 [Siniperca chuatsi]|uniref:protein piccolo-like isoform X2 n=1 Tax=Siniperca chuatsi TaxID=119488 RepID=UPI001CE1524D|nr:protein piccolo-like isoform X2 [Siniperca chuatsi]
MACRESGSSKNLFFLGLFLVASSFCHCTRLTKLKALDKLRGMPMLSQGKAKESDLCHGRLLIGQTSLQGAKHKGPKATKTLLDVDTGYQADMGWGESKQPGGQGDGFSRLKSDNAGVQRLLKMEPKVECTGDSMTLQVKDATSTTGSLIFVDRGSRLSPLPLSKLPPSCGYTIRSTQRELVLVAPYDGCFVTLEEDSYVLPLRWWGSLVRMSCPLMRPSSVNSPNPPMVTCHAEGMVVKMEWKVSVAKIKVNLAGDWEPLMKASPRCGFSVVVHPEGVVISVRYVPCLEREDGMYTLELAGEGETKISCPSLSPAQSEQFYETPPDPDGVPPAHRPELKPLPTISPLVKTTNGQRWQPFYPFPFPPQPLKPETQLTQPPGKLEEDFNVNLPYGPLQKPVASSVSQPEGQEHKPLHPIPFYPLPPASEAPQVGRPYPLYPENPETLLPEQPLPSKPPVSEEPAPEKPTAVPRPPQPEAPQGQVQQPFYPYPFYPKPAPEKPTAVPWPPQPEAPQGQVQQPFYPFYPKPAPEKPTAVPWPPQPEAPQGQVQQPFYPYPFYPQPAPEKPTAVAKPPQPEAPQGQVQQLFYPYPFYPQPKPENQAVEKPAIPQPPTETPKRQVPKPLNPQPSNIPSPYVPPVYCPQFCQSGLSNCCPQIAFHQQIHIFPAGFGSKDAPSVYSGLPLYPSVAYSGSGNILASPLLQKPTEAKTIQGANSAPISPHFLQSGNEKQPPDGNPAALTRSNPSKPTHPEQIYPYLVPNSLYHHWPYLLQNKVLQNLPQNLSPAYYNVSSKLQAPGNEPVNLVQYEPYNTQPPKQQNVQLSAGDMNNPSGFNFMSLTGQYLKQQQSKPTAKETQPSNEKSSNSKQPTQVQGELDHLRVPYYMLQDAQQPTYNKSVPDNSPQPFVSGSKKSTKYEPLVHAYPEPKSYVLLQHGPPGREPNSFNESPLPFRDLAHDANFMAQNLARHQSSKPQHPQNLKPPPEKPQDPKWLMKGMSNPLTGPLS